mgnify:CR=1 FL=1
MTERAEAALEQQAGGRRTRPGDLRRLGGDAAIDRGSASSSAVSRRRVGYLAGRVGLHVFTAILALIFTALNAAVLVIRLRVETRALSVSAAS